jgi:hypothetical protein
VRIAVNWLRQERFYSPYPEPAVDRSDKPYVPPPGLLDPSPLARAILGSHDPEEREVLWQQLNTVTESLLAAHDGNTSALLERLQKGVATPEESRFAAELFGGKVERPAHRTKGLGKEIGEATAEALLRTWYYLDPRQRLALTTVISDIERECRISRTRAYELLAHSKAEVIEHAELGDGTVVEPATAMRASVGFVIRRLQDKSRGKQGDNE